MICWCYAHELCAISAPHFQEDERKQRQIKQHKYILYSEKERKQSMERVRKCEGTTEWSRWWNEIFKNTTLLFIYEIRLNVFAWLVSTSTCTHQLQLNQLNKAAIFKSHRLSLINFVCLCIECGFYESQ